jgi:hypothetical protein
LIGFRGGFWRVDKQEPCGYHQAKTHHHELLFHTGLKGFSGVGESRLRGDTKFISGGTYYFENWNLYPISKIKYSLAFVTLKEVSAYLDLG